MNLLYDTTSKLINLNQHPPQPSLKKGGGNTHAKRTTLLP